MPRLTFAFRNKSAIRLILGRKDQELKAGVRQEVKKSGVRLLSMSKATSPVDTGFMRDHIRLTFTPAGFGYDVGWKQSDFRAAGLAWYPPFVIYGTRRMPARPFIEIAWNRERPTFTEAVKAVIRRVMGRP